MIQGVLNAELLVATVAKGASKTHQQRETTESIGFYCQIGCIVLVELVGKAIDLTIQMGIGFAI